MRLEAGTLLTMTVDRQEDPNGYRLRSRDGDEVLLPYSERTNELSVGDSVEVFLFHDAKDRLAATMRKPLAVLGELACLEVADKHPRLGCFLEIGIGRQLLLPLSELPIDKERHPEVGDRVHVVMTHDKQGRMLALAAKDADFAPLVFHAPADWRGRKMLARIYKPGKDGDFAVVEGGVLGFGALGMVHPSERTRSLRMGEQLELRVTYVRDDGRVNLSMRAQKEVMMQDDAQKLLEALKQRPNGGMPYSDKTDADIIMSRFQMSKAAFKRALGKLMKNGLVYQKENWTYLKDGVPDHEAYVNPEKRPDTD